MQGLHVFRLPGYKGDMCYGYKVRRITRVMVKGYKGCISEGIRRNSGVPFTYRQPIKTCDRNCVVETSISSANPKGPGPESVCRLKSHYNHNDPDPAASHQGVPCFRRMITVKIKRKLNLLSHYHIRSRVLQ